MIIILLILLHRKYPTIKFFHLQSGSLKIRFEKAASVVPGNMNNG